MDDASDFQRVKSLWQTRVTRAASREAPPAFVAAAKEPEPVAVASATASTTSTASATVVTAELSPRAAVSAEPAPPSPPHTPAPDEYFYAAGEADSKQRRAEARSPPPASPVPSSASTASVSPSKSATSTAPAAPTPSSVVGSVLRTLSDATLLRGRSTSNAVTASADQCGSTDSSPKDGATHLSLAGLSVPDVSSWKDKVKLSYVARSKPQPSTAAASASTSNGSPSSSSSTLKTLATTWKSMSGHTMKAAVNEANAAPVDGAELARSNVHHVSSKVKPAATGHRALTCGSPYGELIVVEVLATRDLPLEAGEGENNSSARPYAVIQYDSITRTSVAPSTTAAHHASSATQHTITFNERFVFWVPSSPALEQQTVSVTFRRHSEAKPARRTGFLPTNQPVEDDDQLGEVHLSLAMPVNEAFDDWFPLVRASDGAKKGTARLGLRRLVLTSPTVLEAARTLAARNRSLNVADRNAFGATLPELWEGFTDVEEPPTASASTDHAVTTAGLLGKQTEVLASKLSGLSRRLMGGGSATEVRRDVF